MRYRQDKDEVLRILTNSGEELSHKDMDLFYDLLSEYYYNGVNFYQVRGNKAAEAYKVMSDLKKEGALTVFKDSNAVFIDAKHFIASPGSQLKHRREMIKNAIYWMESNHRSEQTNRTRAFIEYLASYQHRDKLLELGIDARYTRETDYDNNRTNEFNELLLTDLDGNQTYNFMESVLWDKVKDVLGDTYQFGEHKISMLVDAIEYIKSLTDEEIESNSVNHEIRIRGKRYGKGAKLTRILTALQDMDYMQYKTADEFNLQETQDEIFLTSNVIGAPVAGIISESCFSPAGSNSYSNIYSANYSEVSWAFSKELDWRCILTFDEAEMKVAIHDGYPTNRIQNIRAIQFYLESKGYEVVDSRYFYYSEVEYWSYDSPFRYEDQEEVYEVTADWNEKPTLTSASTRISIPAYDIGDNTLTIWSEDENSMGYCDICDGYHMNVNYIGDYSRCEYCAQNYFESKIPSTLNVIRNKVVDNVISGMDNTTTIDTITDVIEELTEYISEHAYSIMGRIVLHDWDDRDFTFIDSKFKEEVEEATLNMNTTYADNLNAEDYNNVLNQDTIDELEDYFNHEHSSEMYYEYLGDGIITEIADELTAYVYED